MAAQVRAFVADTVLPRLEAWDRADDLPEVLASDTAVWAVDVASRLAASRSYAAGDEPYAVAPRRPADPDRRGRQ